MTGITLLHTASHQRYSVTAQYPTTPRASKVETQNFASHKQTYAIYWDDETPVIVAFIARETQDFASLPADAIVIIAGKLHDIMRCKTK